MKIAFLEARRSESTPENSITVAVRNMLALQGYFNAEFFYSASQIKAAKDDYDIIVCGFGTFSTEINESVAFINRNKKAVLFWLVSDYEQTCFAPLFYSKRKFHIIKSFKHEMKNKMAQEQFFVNINALLSDGYHKNKTEGSGIIYYGRWRNDREAYFREYLRNYVFLSTSNKNKKKFIQCGCNPLFVSPLKWTDGFEDLRKYKVSLYIEDAFTHDNYCSPANRFYEAIKCGVHQLFQVESIATFKEYGLEIPNDLIVSNGSELFEKYQSLDTELSNGFMENAGKIARLEKEDVLNSLNLIFKDAL